MALQRWSIDPARSRIDLHVRQLGISNVLRRFERCDGVIELDPDQPAAARVAVIIDASSAFESREIERRTLDDYEVAGDLTIGGVTRRVVLAVTRSRVSVDRAGNQRVGFAIAGAIRRKDFGLGGAMAGDKVTITAELEAVRLPETRQVTARATADSPASSRSY